MPEGQKNDFPKEEYELVPLTPIRRIEKRVEKIERSGIPTEAIHEMTDAVRANQQVAEEVVKLNAEMIRRVSDLTTQVSELSSRISDMVAHMHVSEVPEAKERKKDSDRGLDERMDKLEKRLNALIVVTMPRRMRQSPQPMM